MNVEGVDLKEVNMNVPGIMMNKSFLKAHHPILQPREDLVS